jgi:hypothetical protein
LLKASIMLYRDDLREDERPTSQMIEHEDMSSLTKHSTNPGPSVALCVLGGIVWTVATQGAIARDGWGDGTAFKILLWPVWALFAVMPCMNMAPPGSPEFCEGTPITLFVYVVGLAATAVFYAFLIYGALRALDSSTSTSTLRG